MKNINFHYAQSLSRHYKLVIIMILSILSISAVITAFIPRQYSSTVGLLIVQGKSLNTDPYIADRSLERFSQSLSEVVKTAAFFNDVMQSGVPINDSFSRDEAKRREEWKKKIQTEIVPQTGILKITVYDQDKYQAEQILKSIAAILTSEKGSAYYGNGENIAIKIVDFPLTSSQPTKPNIAANLVMSLTIGIFSSIMLAIILDQRPQKKISALSPEPITPSMPLAARAKPMQKQKTTQEILSADKQVDISTPDRYNIQSAAPMSPDSYLKFEPKQKKSDIVTIFDHVRNLEEANKNLVFGGTLPME